MKSLGIMLCLLLIVGCDQKNITVQSASMAPTVPEGSMVVADFAAYDAHPPQRNDLVCFRPEMNPDWIWLFRVAGLPGERVSLSGDTICVNGTPTSIRGIVDSPDSILTRSIRLESDEYFVLGDNTRDAVDSRYTGPILRSQILGKVVRIEPPEEQNEAD